MQNEDIHNKKAVNKAILYGGMSASPSDYISEDGELSLALDIWKENGAMRPVNSPEVVMTLAEGYSVVLVHKIATKKIYIVRNGNSLFWTEGSVLNSLDSSDINEILAFNVIGSMLIVSTDVGMRYYLWGSAHYTYLGIGLPECRMSFGLVKDSAESAEFTANLKNGIYICSTSKSGSIFNYNRLSDLSDEVAEQNSDAVTDTILGQVNKLIAEKATRKGRFVFPFFVRYALRLVDDSLVHHSAPMLMMPSDGLVPEVACFNSHSTDARQTELKLRVRACTFGLDYAVVDDSSIAELKKYSSIVKSVDIFISAPIYKYKQSGKITSMSVDSKSGSGIAKQSYGDYAKETYTYGMSFTGTPTCYVNLPQYDDSEFEEDLTTRGQFYLLKSIPIGELSSVRTGITIAEDYLGSLVNRELMTDDWDSHDVYVPKYMNTYNSSLNMAGLEKIVFRGFGAEQFTYCSYEKENIVCNVTIKTSSGNITVRSDEFSINKNGAIYLYYPNPDAVEASIGVPGEPVKYVKLRKHSALNGAYFFNDFKNIYLSGFTGEEPERKEHRISIPNKLYTSKINNPFIFPVGKINTIGSGELVGMATAAKALSQGQFGQFPMYAFCTDGIWALTVSASGGFSSVAPVTMDVCINPQSIAQLDQSVAFISENGLMILSGSEAHCISDAINDNRENLFLLSELPGCAKAFDVVDDTAFDMVPFREYIKEAGLAYDYVSQRIILYNTQYGYSYIYAIKSKEWFTMRSNITGKVPSYPECLLSSGTKLLDYAKRNPVDSKNQIIVTRPLHLDYADVYKTIDNIIQRGVFKDGNISVILYGSRNLYDWFPVFSSTNHYLRGFGGTPYRYYRIAIKCTMKDGESLSGCSVQYRTKLTNQPR